MSSDLSSIESQFNLNSVKPNFESSYEFEDFRLDAAQLMLYRREASVNLAPKVVETLLALVERGGEIVSKEELMNRLWKNSFVEESNLTQNIYLLRKTLGKTADGRELIETFRRRGYRFNGEIKKTPATALFDNAKNHESIAEFDAPGERNELSEEIQNTEIKANAAENFDVEKTASPADFSAADPPAGERRAARRSWLPLIIVGFLLVVGLTALIWLAVGRSASESSSGAPIRTLAVMPLVNEGDSANTEYLSDGITESLITNLSRLPELSVKARSSALRYKGRDVPLKNIGAELSVQAILTGRVAARGDELVINVELVDARTENVLWKADYTRPMANIATLQSEITRDIAQRLRIKLTGANEQSFAKNNADSETFQLYLKGRHHLNKIIPVDLNKAIAYFEQAIARDPNYAPAYAGLADTYVALAGFHGRDVPPPREFWSKAKDAANKAVALDAQSAVAQIAYANVAKSLDYNLADAARAAQTALELDPSSADAHALHAEILYHSERDAEALAEYRRALELDPLSMQNSIKFGFFLINTKQDAEAEAQMKKTMDLDPKLPTPHFVLYRLYMANGKHAEAVREFTTVGDILGYAETARKQREIFARDGWEGFLRFENERFFEGQKSYYVRASDIAINYAQLGENDRALEYLERAFYNREPMMLALRRSRLFENLRGDARFVALVNSIEKK